MMKYNVKKIDNTNTMTTTLTTSCKKRDTAIRRFCRFLSEYDSCFKDSLLIATAKTYYAGDTECCLYKADIETDEYIMVYTEYTPMNENTNNNVVFTLIIEFKHDENTTTYKSLANTFVSNNTNDNETATDTKDTESDTNGTNKDTVTIDIGSLDDVEIDLSQETSTDNKTPAELKAEINKKYGVNAVYYDTDSILCDAEKQNVCVHQNKTTDNEVYATTTKIIVRDVCENDEICTITPYENEKELTTPIQKMMCLTNVIDYVTRLYDMNVVTRETYFVISRVGKRDVVLTYTNTHIKELSHLIDNIRFNTQEYCDKYFD